MVRGAVVDLERGRAAADVDAKALPRERLLEDALAEIAGEEQRVRPVGRYRRQKPQLRHPEILRLVDHDMGKRLRRPVPVERSRRGEQARRRHQPALREALADPREHRPKALALPRTEPVFAAHPRHLRIGCGAVDLPGVDDVGPLRDQELLGEAALPRLLRRLRSAARTSPGFAKLDSRPVASANSSAAMRSNEAMVTRSRRRLRSPIRMASRASRARARVRTQLSQ
jgi:hypothetical protein